MNPRAPFFMLPLAKPLGKARQRGTAPSVGDSVRHRAADAGLCPFLPLRSIRPRSLPGAAGAGGLLPPLPSSAGSQLRGGLGPQHRAATPNPPAAPSRGETGLRLSCTHENPGEGREGAWGGPAAGLGREPAADMPGEREGLVLQAGHGWVRDRQELRLQSPGFLSPSGKQPADPERRALASAARQPHGYSAAKSPTASGETRVHLSSPHPPKVYGWEKQPLGTGTLERQIRTTPAPWVSSRPACSAPWPRERTGSWGQPRPPRAGGTKPEGSTARSARPRAFSNSSGLPGEPKHTLFILLIKPLWRTRDHETFSNRGVLCKYDIIYCSVSENYSGIGTSVQPTVREMRVTYVQRFQDTEKLCKEEVVSGTFWSLFIETFCPTVNPPILGRPIYLPRGPCKALATPPSRLREQQRGRRSAALVTRRVWLRGAVLLGKREKAPYPLGKQKMAPTPPVSEAGGPAAQFLLSRVSVPRDGEAASPRLPQRLPSARSPQAQVSPAERCQRGSPAPVGPRRWAERREQLGSDAISGGSAGLATKETQGQLLSEGKQGGPSLGDRRPSGGRAQKQLCPKTGLAAGARGAGTKQHRRGSTYTGVSSPVPR